MSIHHKFVGDFGGDEAEGEDVQTGVFLKQLDGRLFIDHHSEQDNRANVQDR